MLSANQTLFQPPSPTLLGSVVAIKITSANLSILYNNSYITNHTAKLPLSMMKEEIKLSLHLGLFFMYQNTKIFRRFYLYKVSKNTSFQLLFAFIVNSVLWLWLLMYKKRFSSILIRWWSQHYLQMLENVFQGSVNL